MATRCAVCSKTINNNKERLRTVTFDTEAKIKFGYYSPHKEVLNGSLFGPKIHETCYKRYYDRWYNKFVRNITNDCKQETSSVSNENHDNDDDISENNDNDNKPNDLSCSTAISTNPAVIKKQVAFEVWVWV
ncbi:unnamed protein product [Rotaria sordida]|uniref:Uncharacterized protein n=2 Tax=Rotaria sordida TaxID=392033 RepID=A0A814B225_9BILA|nr:unnamed protein product [Rotaria sordida]